MNTVNLIGRLVRDPEVRYTPETQLAIASFTIAIDRPVKKNGEKGADFPRIIAFGKTAEICEKHLGKGQRVGVQGRIQTGKYTKDDGTTVYTTDVVADRVDIIDWKNSNAENNMPDTFEEIDEDVPF